MRYNVISYRRKMVAVTHNYDAAIRIVLLWGEDAFVINASLDVAKSLVRRIRQSW